MRSGLLFLSLLVLPAQAAAQANDAQDEEGSAAADAIIVTATRIELPASQIPALVTLIGEDDIAEQLTIATDIQSVLAQSAPGFAPSRQKLTGFGESFRGRSPLYLIDGVPQSNPLRDASRDGHTFDPIVIERIEIVNGANAIQGLGATGGIVNYVTRSAESSGEWSGGVRASVIASDGLNDDGFEYRLGGYLSRRFGSFDIVGAASYHRRELFYDGRGRTIGVDSTQGDLADSGQRNFFGKIGWEPTSEQRLQLTVNDYRVAGDGDFSTLDGDRARGIPAEAAAVAPPGEPTENDVTTVSLDYRHDDLFGGELNAQLFYQDFAATFGGNTFGLFQDPAIAPVGTLFEQSQTRSEKLGARLTQRYAEIGGSGVDVIGGVDLLRDETEQALIQTGRLWVPNTVYENIAPFVQLNAPLWDGLRFAGGLRYEIARLEVADYRTIAGNRDDFQSVLVEGGSPDFEELLGNAALVYEFVPGISAYVSYAQGFTVPDAGRVLRGVSEFGTAVDDLVALQPVVADNYEAGVTVSSGGLTAQLAYYISTSDFGSRLVANADGIFDLQREKTRIEGFEASLEARLGGGFSAGGNLSLLSGRVDTDDDGALDADLDAANIGPDRLNLYLAYRRDALSLRLQSATLFDRDFSDAAGLSSADFDGYTLADLYAGYETPYGTFSLGIQNLTDEFYLTYFAQAGTTRADRFFAGRGRTFTLGYALDF